MNERMLKIIPYKKYAMEINQNADRLIEKISSEVEPKQSFRKPFSRKHKIYEGEVYPNGFKIQRIIGYQSSCLPLIKGHLKQLSPSVTQINITMSLHLVHLILEIFVFVIFGGFFIRYLIQGRIDSIVITFVWLIILYLFLLLGFKEDVEKDQKNLKRIIQSQF